MAKTLCAAVDAAYEWFFAAVRVFVFAKVLAQGKCFLAITALIFANSLVN